MANTLDKNGLTLETRQEILDYLKTNWQNIYGNDVSFDSNTSDGQLLEIFTQACIDNNEVINEIYNSFSPTKCGGTVQDERYAINGVFRKIGDYTIQPITITVNKTVTLQGTDGVTDDENIGAYTIQSDNGEQWYLLDTSTITVEQSPIVLPFRAKNKGNVQPAIGTITNQSTVVQGVTSVINDVAPTSYGSDDETDMAFMVRREQSVANGGENNTTSIRGNILALDGVTQCEVYSYEETRDEQQKLIPDSHGVPPYTLWVIVDGGTTQDIVNVIYNNNSNTMLKGDIVGEILSSSGQYIKIHYDRPHAVPLYVKFDIQETVSGSSFDFQQIKEYIETHLIFKLFQYADTSYATEIVRDAMLATSINGVAVNVQLSLNVGDAQTSVSGSITSADTDVDIFYDKIKENGTYVFSYNGSVWALDGNTVNLSDYGITYEGDATSGDAITVEFTQGLWGDFFPSSNPQNQFVVDTSRIYISEINL